MAGLALLIDLSRRAAEERQFNLSQASHAHAQAVAAVEEHENGVRAECQAASLDLDALAAFGRWAADIARRRAALHQRRSDLAHSELAAQGALHDAFIDLKRLELAFDATQDTADSAARRRTDAAADEREQIRRSL
jgi:hypothetical protein